MEQDNQAPEASNIVETQVESQVILPEHGERVTDSLGNETGETVVHDHDENGNVVGWHKEVQEPQNG